MPSLRRAIERVAGRVVMGFEWLETGATFNPLELRKDQRRLAAGQAERLREESEGKSGKYLKFLEF